MSGAKWQATHPNGSKRACFRTRKLDRQRSCGLLHHAGQQRQRMVPHHLARWMLVLDRLDNRSRLCLSQKSIRRLAQRRHQRSSLPSTLHLESIAAETTLKAHPALRTRRRRHRGLACLGGALGSSRATVVDTAMRLRRIRVQSRARRTTIGDGVPEGTCSGKENWYLEEVKCI